MKKLISALLIITMMCCCPFALADQLTDSLNEAVPFGIVHSDRTSELLVYSSPAVRNSIGRLNDYQLCAILSTKEANGILWYEIRYVSNNSFKEGYVRSEVFYQFTLSGLITITADSSVAETLRALSSAAKADPFVSATKTPTATPKATATPKPTAKPTATPRVRATAKPSATPASSRKRYVLNTKTMKFHLPGCSEVNRITDENRKNTTTTRESLIELGYTPCQKCNP